MGIKERVGQVLAEAVNGVYHLKVEPEIMFSDPAFGDLSSNIALKLAKDVKQAPLEVANQLSKSISVDFIKKAEPAAPGFINISLKSTVWVDFINQLNRSFTTNNSGRGKKVQVEFISANPTGPPTLGNARGGYIGDVLSCVLEANGYKVIREYYFNNAGTQVSKLIEAVKAEAGLIEVDDRQYSGDYIKELARDYSEELSSKSDEELKSTITSAIFDRYIKPTVDKMGIHFDVWFNEKDLLNSGTFEETLKLLRHKGLIFEREGALWLNTGKGGDPRGERVFIKSSGEPAYFAPDVAYHVDIFDKRKFDKAIKVLGADHLGQFPSVKAVVGLLFPDKDLDVLIVQWLRLVSGGSVVKMSKRLGRYVTVEELVDQVGSDVARFMMLTRSSDTHMDFDLGLAKEQSQKNPYYYVMYAYARANSILSQASKVRLNIGKSISKLSPLEINLIKQIAGLPYLVKEIANSYEVHKLIFYGIELAKQFHEYYETDRIISLTPEAAAEKLWLVKQIIMAFEEYFKLLGITPIKQM